MDSVAVAYGAQSLEQLRPYAPRLELSISPSCAPGWAVLDVRRFQEWLSMSDEWKSETPKANDDKSWKLLEKAVLAGVQEQRRARRWGYSSSR